MSGQHEAREDTAALGFMAFLALCFGGVGVLVAALAVGVERAWSGRQTGPGSTGWRQAVADHRAWLDSDRQRRVAEQQARLRWRLAGSDPAARPSQPPWSHRVGSALRRLWAWLAVSADRTYQAGGRFGEGFRAGWDAAQQARRDGATPWHIATARPTGEQPAGEPPGDREGEAQKPAATEDPQSQTELSPDLAYEPQVITEEEPPAAAAPQTEQNTSTAPAGTATAGGTTMTAPTATPAATPASSPAGETNLDLTDADLTVINQHLAEIQELNDQLAGKRAALEGAVAVASERVNVNGGTAATQQALDEANAVVTMLGQHLGNVADATTAAADHTSAAQAGLAPARDAQDALHSAGAKGEFVSTATSD